MSDDIRARVLRDGRRVYDVWFTVDGKKYGKRGFPTKKEARDYKRHALTDADRGAFVPPSRQTLGTYLRHWVDGRRPGATTSTYRRHITNHVIDTTFRLDENRRIADVPIQKLTPEHLGSLYRYMQDADGCSANTVRIVNAILRQAFRDATENGYVVRNPAVLARKAVPKATRSEINPYSADEARNLLRLAREDRLHALWRLYLTMGLRRNEGLELRWSDLDLDTARIVVRRGGSSGSTKTDKTRTWTLDARTVAVLRAHRKTQLEVRALLGLGKPGPDDHVFVREDCRPLTEKLIREAHLRLEKRAGIADHRRLHDLRHTAATLALANGLHPKVVSEMLGHASVAFTLDRYVHVLPNMRADAAEQIAGLLDG